MLKFIVLISLFHFDVHAASDCNISAFAGTYAGSGKNVLTLQNGDLWETACDLKIVIRFNGENRFGIPTCECTTPRMGWSCFVGEMQIVDNEVRAQNIKSGLLDKVGKCDGRTLDLKLNNKGQYAGTVQLIGTLTVQNEDDSLHFRSENYAQPNLSVLEGQLTRLKE